MKSETVSVVIPCYNTHTLLVRTIDSVRAQTFPVAEIIVVDDGSTNPETIRVLETVGSDVRVVRQPNKGLPAARNAGFREAVGDCVLPLDSDDWLEPDAIQKLLLALVEAPNAAFSFCQLQMEGEKTGILTKEYNFFEQLFLNQLPYCLLIRKVVWEAIGGYDETMRRGYEDWEFNIRLGANGNLGVVVREPLFHYRVAQSGMLLSTSNKLHHELWSDIRRRHPTTYRLPELLRLWRYWRRFPSTYPLWAYFPWLAAAVVLPRSASSWLFRTLRRYSHGNRVAAGRAGQ